MKIKTAAMACALVLACAGVARADSWGSLSGNAGLVSDYRFRGISKTQERPAVQGNVDWNHPSGAYAGLWGSNVDFGPTIAGRIETDVYGGYKFNVSGLNFDTGVIGYLYPGSTSTAHLSFWEGKMVAGYDFGVAKVSAGFNYSPEFKGKSGNAEYYSLGTVVPVMDTGVSVVGKYGYQVLDKSVKAGYPDYSNWALGLDYKWNDFDFTATYEDTNVPKASCPDTCDATGIVGVSHSF